MKMTMRLRECVMDTGIAAAIVLLALACLAVTAREVRAEECTENCGGGTLVSCGGGTGQSHVNCRKNP
jgi:hypothetical protein